MIRRRASGRHADARSPSTPDRAQPADTPTIAGYGDLSVIGRGATATVYRATQDEFGRTVAIKLLHVDISDRRAQRRFAREKSINGQLSSHPNVVTVFDSGFVDGRSPYLVMEYFGHGSLAKRLGERGPFSLESALHIGIRIAGALESAHAAGVLHRDVKPQNVLLSQFGEPALADFGIATVLEMEQSMTAGLTPVHAAPELLENGEPSPSSDVYALASTVYTLLSGTPPFAGPQGEGVLAQLLRITTLDLPALARSDVPASLVAALRAATAKRPEDRTATAAQFGRVLQAIQSELGLERTSLPVELPDEPARPLTPAVAPADPDAVRVDTADVDTPTVGSPGVPPTVAQPTVAPPPATQPTAEASPPAAPVSSAPPVAPPASPRAKPARSPFAPPDDEHDEPPAPVEPPGPALGPPPSVPSPPSVEPSPAPARPRSAVEPVAAAATSAFATRDDDLDLTVGTVEDEHTVLGRQRHPSRPEPNRRRPHLLMVGAASVVVALGAGGVAMVVGRGDDDPEATPTTVVTSTTAAADVGAVATSEQPADSQAVVAVADSSADTSPATTEAATTLPLDPADLVPSNLHAWIAPDGVVTLEWDAPAVAPPGLFLVILYPDKQRDGPFQVPAGSTTYPVVEIADPSAPLCLMFVVPMFGQPDADPLESAAECINGATIRPSDDAVVTVPPSSLPPTSATS